jgi:hypothetical protein
MNVQFSNHRYSWNIVESGGKHTDTCFIQKMYAPSSSLLQGKHLPFTPSPLRLNIFRLFVILSLTQLYRYTPEIFLFSTATFKYKYRAPSQTNWTRIFSNSRIFYFSVTETDTEEGAYIFWMKQVPVGKQP